MTQYRAVDMLQPTATVAGIALALAAFLHDRDASSAVPIVLLFAGLFCVAGSLYAMGSLAQEMSLRWSDILQFWKTRSLSQNATVYAAWGLYILGFAYVWAMAFIVPKDFLT